MGFFERLGNGWRLAKASWGVVWNDKSLMVFPVLALIAQLVVLGGFLMAGDPLSMIEPYMAEEGAEVSQETQVKAAILLFLVYFVFNSITIFFNVALIGCAVRSIQGEDTTVFQGLGAALSHLPGIFLWSAITSFVGVLLNILERQNKIGEFVAALLGSAWSVLTYFVIPVMVFERANPFSAIGKSKTLIFRTWGEGLGGHIGTGFLSFIAMLPGFAFIFFGITSGFVPLIVLGVVLIVLSVVWGTTASTVLRAALYCYAMKKSVPSEFSNHAESVFYRR